MITVGPQLFARLLYAANKEARMWLIRAAFHRHQKNRYQQKPIDKRIRCGNKSHAASKTAVLLGQPHTSSRENPATQASFIKKAKRCMFQVGYSDF